MLSPFKEKVDSSNGTVNEKNPVEIKTGQVFPLPEIEKQIFRELDQRFTTGAVSVEKLDEILTSWFRNLSSDPNYSNKKGEVSVVADNLKFCFVSGQQTTAPVYIPVIQQILCFMQSNVAATQTNVALDVLGLTGNTEYTMAYRGAVIGVSVASNAVRSAGTLTVEPTINGAGTGLTAVLDGTNTQYHQSTQHANLDTFTAGQRLGCRITTTGTWAPTTADIVVAVYIM